MSVFQGPHYSVESTIKEELFYLFVPDFWQLLIYTHKRYFHCELKAYNGLMENANPEELQRLMRLLVKRVEWMPEGGHKKH